jgi:hypothetical protein
MDNKNFVKNDYQNNSSILSSRHIIDDVQLKEKSIQDNPFIKIQRDSIETKDEVFMKMSMKDKFFIWKKNSASGKEKIIPITCGCYLNMGSWCMNCRQ